MGASFSHHVHGGGIWPDGSWHARPPAASAPPTNPAPEPSLLGSFIHGRLRWLHRLPLVATWHATASTGPRFHEDGQTARPGTRKGHLMTEASVSFAGNLTDDLEVRYTEGGIARAMCWWPRP